MMKAWEYPVWAQHEDLIIMDNIERPQRTWPEIARAIGRTHGAVRNRAVLIRERLKPEVPARVGASEDR